MPAHRTEPPESRLYPEATACAGSGTAPCIMEWAKDGEIKRVHTVGEPPARVYSVEMVGQTANDR